MTTRELKERMKEFRDRKIMVLGDFVADEYIYGRTHRISREAPVLILKYASREIGLGGAGNALNNILSLGGRAIPVGILGRDEMGRAVGDLLRLKGVDPSGLIEEPDRDTTTKTRILAGDSHTVRQQVIRVDRGEYDRISAESEKKIIQVLDSRAKEMDALLISDYQYGVLSPRVIDKVNTLASGGRLIVTVDSRYRMLRFHGVSALTPNEPEVEEAMGVKLDDDEAVLRSCAERILKDVSCKGVLITRGSKGMALFLSDGGSHFIPIHGSDEVADVTGAGDTVIAVFTLALAAGASYPEAARLANIGGGIVVMKRGAATVTTSEIEAALAGPSGNS
jgi:D-glycero-beta-D-manno-heptose-7-phosphate kinase